MGGSSKGEGGGREGWWAAPELSPTGRRMFIAERDRWWERVAEMGGPPLGWPAKRSPKPERLEEGEGSVEPEIFNLYFDWAKVFMQDYDVAVMHDQEFSRANLFRDVYDDAEIPDLDLSSTKLFEVADYDYAEIPDLDLSLTKLFEDADYDYAEISDLALSLTKLFRDDHGYADVPSRKVTIRMVNGSWKAPDGQIGQGLDTFLWYIKWLRRKKRLARGGSVSPPWGLDKLFAEERGPRRGSVPLKWGLDKLLALEGAPVTQGTPTVEQSLAKAEWLHGTLLDIRREMEEENRRVKEAGSTVVFKSEYLSEVGRLGDGLEAKMWSRYDRQIHEFNGFEIYDFPGQSLCASIVPFPDFKTWLGLPELLMKLANRAIKEYNEKECDVFKYEFRNIEKVNFSLTGYNEYFMTVRVVNVTLVTSIETFQIHAATMIGGDHEVIFCCRPKELMVGAPDGPAAD